MLAGVNGAGKSSIGGEFLRAQGAAYFNPDEVAREIRAARPALGQQEANSLAWYKGRDLLQAAIENRQDFNFESTLGAHTIPALLDRAAAEGGRVHVWFVGLDSPERHIARVKARHEAGGHDIPEVDVRRRFESSRENLVWLLPRLTTLLVYDNSAEADPKTGNAPQPRLVLHMANGRIAAPADLSDTPAWARAIVARAIEVHGRR
ncbi:MAG TPA: zeta toxin family protein [Usitatibacter sp.]|nr:zeta toxin family protein [Usitatibacter sp.]